jgi:hypothetical protein
MKEIANEVKVEHEIPAQLRQAARHATGGPR